MSEEGGHARARRHLMFLVLLAGCLSGSLGVQAASVSDPAQTKTGTIVETHSDKKVVQTGRWMVVRQFTVNVEVKCSDKTYCGEITTTVVNEVDDLMANKGQSVECSESGHDLDLTLKSGRRVKAHQVSANKCAQN